MRFFGLSWLDALVIALYAFGTLWVSHQLSRSVRGETDFFLAGRKLGRCLQFFLNFGNMTDPATAAATTSSVYREGASGVWLGMIPLFLTPYYWFMNGWFRRVRLVTIADLFEDRFGGRTLPVLYAVTNILVSLLAISFTDIVTLKSLQPIMTKPSLEWTAQERAMVADYHEYVGLKVRRQAGTISAAEEMRFTTLRDLESRGEIAPIVSYLHPALFYFVLSAIIAVFVILGGLKASAVVDALQALLVVAMSVILIPFGLLRIGGFGELHKRVPDSMFSLFGTGGTTQYTWYSISAFLLVAFVGINGSYANMSISGSARNETAARVGAIAGGFGKRLMTIAWCFCGLVAVALFRPALSDPDQSWGLLTQTLLPTGLVGVMIIGILGGSVAHQSANGVVISALVVKNIYTPLFPGRSEDHYLKVARITVAIVLMLGAILALCFQSATALLTFMITLGVAWGGPIFLIFLWRRLTARAVQASVIVTLLVIGVLPWVVTATPALRQMPSLTQVSSPLAREKLGNPPSRANAVSLFFEGGVVRSNPRDPTSSIEGLGRFNIEVYLLSLAGLDLSRSTPATLLTVRCLVDALLPLVLLVALSHLTPPEDPSRAARFYAKLKVPVAMDPEEDRIVLQRALANPASTDPGKLFRHSDWEFGRWSREDALGFFGSCLFVLVILAFFQLVLRWGA